MNPWLVFSLLLLGIWFIIFLVAKGLRKKMFIVSLITMPFGLTELLFVPAYWNPPSLFDLSAKTGFDIESLIFSFAVGGIGAVLYDFLFKNYEKKIGKKEMQSSRHKFHLAAIFSPLTIFLLLEMFTELNPIYLASISMFVGGIAIILCRPSLKNKIFVGGILFSTLYFLFFLFITLIYPNIVEEVWNLEAISGILMLGVPLEEFIFAFTFGMMWSGIYEHIFWRKSRKI